MLFQKIYKFSLIGERRCFAWGAKSRASCKDEARLAKIWARRVRQGVLTSCGLVLFTSTCALIL
jgi:hypothetical protein